jgi:hypothetical protein
VSTAGINYADTHQIEMAPPDIAAPRRAKTAARFAYAEAKDVASG